jgi:cyclopropane-fatty-acyl-phospholipid synthase
LHYATTLNRWRKNFFACLTEVREQGFSDTFIRMWEYYLCYCEGAFLERAISDVQILFAKPTCRLKTV